MVAEFTKKLVDRVRGWVGSQVVSDVPDDIAACEFECKRPECSDEKFIGCERRRRAQAIAELAADAGTASTGPAAAGVSAAVAHQTPSVTA